MLVFVKFYKFPRNMCRLKQLAGQMAESVVPSAVVTRDVQARIRKRIRDRLDDLGMTGRELAKACGNSDGWISGLLEGRQGLHWKDFDRVAEKLGLSPSELVRYDDSELRELTPSEMRVLRHFREWPESIKHRWLDVLDYFAATAPDQETAGLLVHLRDTPRSLRAATIDWLSRLAQEGIPPTQLTGGGVPQTTAKSASKSPTHRDRRPRKPGATRDIGDDRTHYHRRQS
jgi:transcriptional regulator with XRE-family HTH domain